MASGDVYLDECIPANLARLLIARGLTVHRPAQTGAVSIPDSIHLATCATQGWVLITQNRRDFRRLRWLWTALHNWGVLSQPHAGILTSHEQVTGRVADWALAIEVFLQQQTLQGEMYRWRPTSGQWDREPAALM